MSADEANTREEEEKEEECVIKISNDCAMINTFVN